MRNAALGSKRLAHAVTQRDPPAVCGSLCLAGHLQDKGFARGLDDSFAPIFRIIDPEHPTKLRTSVGVGYLGHEARPPKSAEDLVGLVVVEWTLKGPFGEAATEAR